MRFTPDLRPGSMGRFEGTGFESSRTARIRTEGHDEQGEIRADEAARERGHDRSRGPWEDDVDGGDHGGPEEEGAGGLRAVRPDRQGAGGEGAGDHDRDGARGVRDGEPSLRARELAESRRLSVECYYR